ncbi:GNAT family N-acetyltransferase, partial [Candidatus Pelagibacter sp.]|nr:GNAT family N-acetyltransferase [Candidatus Pelagibacter sp.]
LFEKNNIKFSYFDNENIHQHFENELSKFSILQSLSFYGDKLIDYLKVREQGMEPDNSDVIISNGKIADESQIKKQYVDRVITTAAFKKKNKSVVTVAKSSKPTVQVTSKDKIRLNLIKKRDHFFLINIYNENVRKRNFFGLKQIPLKEHFEWYNANKRKNIIFIAKLKSNIGYVRFTQKNKHWHVSIAIKKNYQRKGYGSYLLNKSIQKFKKKDTKIISTIKRSNISSVNFFKKNNFKYYFSDNKKIMLSHYVK